MTSLADLIDVSALPPAWRTLAQVAHPWEVLERLDALLVGLEDIRLGDVHPTAVIEGPVVIEAGARIGPHAYVKGPAWLMAGAEIGHGAFARGGVLMGAGARLGHASEAKRAILLAGAKVPHFNYVGDSLVGHRVNLGAGVKLANFKAVGDQVRSLGVATGLRKLGAIVGDDVSIGCNAVLAPGTVVGRGSVIYQNASVRGEVPPHTVVKVQPSTEMTTLRSA